MRPHSLQVRPYISIAAEQRTLKGLPVTHVNAHLQEGSYSLQVKLPKKRNELNAFLLTLPNPGYAAISVHPTIQKNDAGRDDLLGGIEQKEQYGGIRVPQVPQQSKRNRAVYPAPNATIQSNRVSAKTLLRPSLKSTVTGRIRNTPDISCMALNHRHIVALDAFSS